MELTISASPQGAVCFALEVAHSAAAKALKTLPVPAFGSDVAFVGRVYSPSELTLIERTFGFPTDVLSYHLCSFSPDGVRQVIEEVKSENPYFVVVEAFDFAKGDGPSRVAGLHPSADVFRSAARANGWNLIFCCAPRDRDEEADRVRDALCEKGLHEIVRDDEVGIKVYDTEDVKFCADLPRLEPGQVALEYPPIDDETHPPDVYDIETLLKALAFVTPGSYEGWNDDDMDAVDWEALRHDLKPALASQKSSDPS